MNIVSLISAEPLYQNVRIDHRIIFDFGKKVNNHDKSQVESWFFWFSLIFVFSVSLPNLSLVTFLLPPGPTAAAAVAQGGAGAPGPSAGGPGPGEGGEIGWAINIYKKYGIHATHKYII